MAPPRCWATAQAAHFSYHIQIQDGSEEGQDHHRDANGVLMEAMGWSVNARSRGESAESDGDAHAADGDNGGASALQDSKDYAGPIQELGIQCKRCWLRGFCAARRDVR